MGTSGLLAERTRVRPKLKSPGAPDEGLTLEKIASRKLTVGVIGLGYVGLPLSLVFAEAGASVIGFDVDESKKKSINNGSSYFQHISNERVSKSVDSKLFKATTDFSSVSNCDAVVICVPTPLDAHLQPDLRYVEETCRAIAPFLQPGTLVALESTTWPGTTEEVVGPILEAEGRLKVGETLYMCFSPEREDPGNPMFGTKNIPKLVGGSDPKSLELAVALYELAVDSVVPLSSTRVAEAAKLFENIFRSVNIALVNEMKMILDKMDVDVWEVIEAASSKPFGFMPFWPGPGLGGHCIPIDPFYLTWKAKEYGVSTRFIELAGQINHRMPDWVVGKVQDALNDMGKALKGSKVLVLGLAYKPDIGDTRESPSRKLISLMEGKGALVDYHDPHVLEIGSSRDYPALEGRTSHPMSVEYDCFVLATHHSCFDAEEILSYGVPVVDTRNVLPKNKNVTKA
jgi:UDP-N-acetyl-D-glucosamine dehydrogenase